MNAVVGILTNSQNAGELAFVFTALFTAIFQRLKDRLPEKCLWPVSFVAGALIGVAGALVEGPSEGVAFASDILTAALMNAAIPTGWFKAGQNLGFMRAKETRT